MIGPLAINFKILFFDSCGPIDLLCRAEFKKIGYRYQNCPGVRELAFGTLGPGWDFESGANRFISPFWSEGSGGRSKKKIRSALVGREND